MVFTCKPVPVFPFCLAMNATISAYENQRGYLLMKDRKTKVTAKK
jgi:hypothetical protein